MNGGAAGRLLLRAAAAAFGVLWLAGAASKVIAPLEPFEFTTYVIPGRTAAVLTLALTAAAEAALGVAMIAGALRGFLASSALVAVTTAALLHVRYALGGKIPCGCFAAFTASTVDEAIRRNQLLLGAALVLAVVAFIADRRERRDRPGDPGAAAASGPATATP